MLRVKNFSALKKNGGPVVMAAGFFDGVHRGHQRVITAARTAASATNGGVLWVLTFETHPLHVLAPERAPPLLTSAAHKMRLLEKLGVDGCLSLPFDQVWASLEPETFLDRLLHETPRWSALFIGPNWRFGRHAAGNEALLRKWAGRNGIGVTAIPPVMWDGDTVSSTRIRKAVAVGRLEEAAAMLGRPFSVMGTVERGHAMGRRLGYPTANVQPDNEVRPPHGVYAVAVVLENGYCCRGVMNLGQRPTFAGKSNTADIVMEVHLHDENRDLYGQRVEILIIERLRDEHRFDHIDGLRRQIAADIDKADRILKKKVDLRALQISQDDIHFGPYYVIDEERRKKEEQKEGP